MSDKKPLLETPIRRRGFLGALAAIPAAFHLGSVVQGKPDVPSSEITKDPNQRGCACGQRGGNRQECACQRGDKETPCYCWCHPENYQRAHAKE